jgi:ABC-2 type transport system permease protein
MFTQIARFEIAYQLRKVTTHAYFGILFLYAAVMVARAWGVFGAAFDLVGDGGVTRLNSPFVIHLLVTLPSYFGIVVVAALMVDAACRDLRHRSYAFVYTKPVTEAAFLAGRFVGALTTLIYVFSAPALAIWAMTSLPLGPAERVGPFQPLAYLMPYVVTVVPNLAALGALLFAVASGLRREAPAYVLAVMLLGAFVLARALSGDLAGAHTAALLDPFGYVATSAVMDRLWTPAARDTLPVALQGWVLENRLLWTGAGVGTLVALCAFFRFSEPDTGRERRRRARRESRPSTLTRSGAAGAAPRVPTRPLGMLALVLDLARFELGCALGSPSFRLMLLGLLAVGAALVPTVGVHEGTPSHPVTFLVLADLAGSLLPLAMLFVVFYAGELLWRERDLGTQEICDATPAPSGARLSSKLLALSGLIGLLLAVVAGSGLLAQLASGYHRFELKLYLVELFGFRLSLYLLFGVLALFVHVVVNHKYLGHFVMALLFVLLPNLSVFGLSHPLVRFGGDPGYVYSDFTGYGHFVLPVVLFRLYWGAFGALLLMVARLFWPRGSVRSLTDRIRMARRRFGRRLRWMALAAAGVVVALGAVLAHGTLAFDRSEAARERAAAELERRYAGFEGLPQPRIVAVSVDVDLRPDSRSFRASGRYTLRNRTERAIGALHLCLPGPELELLTASADREWSPEIEDRRLGYFSFALARPLEPGEEMLLSFVLSSEPRGFTAPATAGGVLSNGTLLMSGDWAPHVGYLKARELTEPALRARHGLAPREDLPPADQPGALETGVHRDADYLRFEATVATDADQIALAPGRLVRDTTEGARRRFTYRMDQPMLNHYAIVSARYATRRGWVGDTALELYYLPEHDFNLDRMVQALKESLAYHARSFGPYPYGVLRLAEVPRPARFAGRAYAGLLLCSETGGFLTRLGPLDGPEIDTVSSLIAHEVGHQWWGHQVAGADVLGGPFVQETLSQYSRLRVLARMQGPEVVRRLLQYAHDEYLNGRGSGSQGEHPLASVGREPHVFYSKGLLAMNALTRYAGEERLNAALAGHVRENAFRAPPYASAAPLLQRLRAAAPKTYQPMVGDLLETITLHDARALSAQARRTPSGQYRVTLEVEVRKRRADSAGAETEIPVDDWIEIGVYGAETKELHLAMTRVGTRVASLEIEVAERPERVSVDPYGILIDTDPSNNTLAVELRAGDGA